MDVNKMDGVWFKDWWPFLVLVIGQIVTAAVMWTKLIDKVNGQGSRISSNTNATKTLEGRVDRMEHEMQEYRRDAQDSAKGLARVEKGVEEVHDSINQGNLQLGSQLHAMEKSIQEKDVRTQVRLTRIETVAKIEEKVGPLPVE